MIEMKRVTKNSVTFDRFIFKAERNSSAKVKGNKVIAIVNVINKLAYIGCHCERSEAIS